MNIGDRQVSRDLDRFKKFIENRGGETGAWRGDVEQGTGDVTRGDGGTTL